MNVYNRSTSTTPICACIPELSLHWLSSQGPENLQEEKDIVGAPVAAYKAVAAGDNANLI